MINRVVLVAVFVPLAIILIALAVANRGAVPFTLDPFNPGNPGLTTELPLFVLLFAALAIGLVVGSAATWWKQGHYRKMARRRDREVQELRATALKTAAEKQAAAVPALSRPAA